MPDYRILGVRVDAIGKADLERSLVDAVRSDARKVFAYVNVHAVNLARIDSRFRRFLDAADVVYCDGEGVRLGARILGQLLPPRIVLTHWIWDLCALFEREGISVFFLGASNEVSSKAVAEVHRRFPRLRIAGSHHGYFTKSGPENEQIIAAISAARPDVLFVGFGMPLQEYWLEDNLERLTARAVLPAGSMIDYVAGVKRTPPAWMSNHGLEWLHRLVKEPRRLWRRYLIGNPQYLFGILIERWKQAFKK
jgi:N-acetylglucosaminyldiphosphoundecaprenol N-acetyl-beta-D-mannosaminyltransferase